MKRSIQRNLFAVGLASLLIYINTFAVQSLLSSNSSNEPSTALQSIESTSQPPGETPAVEEVKYTLDDVFKEQKTNKKRARQMAQAILKNDYNNNLAKAQPDILKSLKSHHLSADDMAYLFLDESPSKHVNSSQQLDIPLLLQTDPEWRNLEYGSDSSRQLWENGCAIVTLSMVKGYLDQSEVTPTNILKWSKQQFYRHNEGTSWQIFSEFAKEFDYNYTDLGNDFYTAMEEVQEGRVVVASVKPGYFTEIGHILVIRGYEDGFVFVNDPNDSPEKLHSYQGVPAEVFLNEGVNYWSFSN
ncbi:C39 family peptidase [Dolosicoccus paucivorans]|uniref:Peptidase C39-like domain-containing protein n=1 Tax=Dolosicoccus paucivorans TaxID=84521 RepID=A0A1G8K681_9LACT|nr:C39 family peptidase [Dolosicoccus paucivorans]PMB84724.1 hypothetical protein CJ206_02255 [Dolosicoccus paucivorans]PMC58807.1 hypothetical protein CJ205_02490 [Dolosicoccus paucivorans]SDI38903.1 Peptidase_C39 like family protein [Dolosicoccus paucivorans]